MTPEQLNALTELLAQQAGMDFREAESMILRTMDRLKQEMKQPDPEPQIRRYQNLEDANRARQKEYGDPDVFSLVYFGNALAGETGELCNIIKKMEREKLGMPGSRASKEEAADEIGDVGVYLSLVAIKLDIDLNKAIIDKFNKTSEKLGFMTRLG